MNSQVSHSKIDQSGFSLVELMIYTVVFSLVVLGGLQLMSTFQLSNQRIADLAESSQDVDTTILRLNTLLTDSSDFDICNVYKTDTTLSDAQELGCPLDPDHIRDASCLIMRGNNLSERWGVEFDGDDHIAMDIRSLVANNSDLSISMWIQDAECTDSDGCMLVQLGSIDENMWWGDAGGDNDRIALLAKNDSGDLQLEMSTQRVGANDVITYPSIDRTARSLEEWNSGTWTHVVLTVEHGDNNDLEFGTTGSGENIEALSFELYINGEKANPTTTLSEIDLDIGVSQLLLFGQYRPHSHFSGLIGPIQIFDEKMNEQQVLELFYEFYAPNDGVYNLSMKLEDYESDTIFSRPASEFEFYTASQYEPICGPESGMPADKTRICRSFTDKESFEDLYESSVQERSSGRAFIFAKNVDSTAPWDERPYALFTSNDADTFCLSATDPGQSDPENSGWERLTEFKYFPGTNTVGDYQFFNRLPDSGLSQLLISSEFRPTGGQGGLAAVGSLNIARSFKSNDFCQIIPDTTNFSIPDSAEDTCDLQYATVVIQEGWQSLIDMLYILPTDGYSAEVSSSPCGADSDGYPSFGSGKNVHRCTKSNAAPDGNTYSKYTFKNIPLLAAEARAVYDAQFGTLTIDAGAGNTPDSETWFQVLKQVSYTTQDSISDDTPYERYRTISFSLGDQIPFYPPDDPNNRPHYYGFVDDGEIDWDTARFAASAATAKFCGLQGYLTSVTSEEENDLIYNRFANADGSIASGWIGGTDHHNWNSQTSSDPEVDDGESTEEGNYRWVDGPEHGEIFWRYADDSASNNIRRTGRYVERSEDAGVQQCYMSGESDTSLATQNLGRFTTGATLPNDNANRCVARPGPSCTANYWFVNFPTYMNSDGTCRTSTSATDTNNILAEPNQAGEEHFIQITGTPTHSGTWNDLPHDNTTSDTTSAYYISGYYVEYGGCTSGTECITDDDPEDLAITARVENFDLTTLRQLCPRPNSN